MQVIPRPRCSIEMLDDGSYQLEFYSNGARQVRQVATMNEISEAFGQFIIPAHKARLERELAKDTAKRKELWKDVAWGTMRDGRGHGEALANRCFGPLSRGMRLAKTQIGTHEDIDSKELL
jgi:hypothetical protein